MWGLLVTLHGWLLCLSPQFSKETEIEKDTTWSYMSSCTPLAVPLFLKRMIRFSPPELERTFDSDVFLCLPVVHCPGNSGHTGIACDPCSFSFCFSLLIPTSFLVCPLLTLCYCCLISTTLTRSITDYDWMWSWCVCAYPLSVHSSTDGFWVISPCGSSA